MEITLLFDLFMSMESKRRPDDSNVKDNENYNNE